MVLNCSYIGGLSGNFSGNPSVAVEVVIVVLDDVDLNVDGVVIDELVDVECAVVITVDVPVAEGDGGCACGCSGCRRSGSSCACRRSRGG